MSPMSRREFLYVAGLSAAALFTRCGPKPTLPPGTATVGEPTERPTVKPTIRPTKDSSEIEPLWRKSDFRDQAFYRIYLELENQECIGISNLKEGESVFLKDPNKKPFYDTYGTPSGIEPAYGEVITYYKKYEDPDFFWPLGQVYKTLGYLNLFLIGAFQDFPQEARTLKVQAQGHVSAEASIKDVFFDGNKQFTGIEIVEVHYDSQGKPIFRCNSRFDKDMVKVEELNIEGKKQEEFYFVWPKLKSKPY